MGDFCVGGWNPLCWPLYALVAANPSGCAAGDTPAQPIDTDTSPPPVPDVTRYDPLPPTTSGPCRPVQSLWGPTAKELCTDQPFAVQGFPATLRLCMDTAYSADERQLVTEMIRGAAEFLGPQIAQTMGLGYPWETLEIYYRPDCTALTPESPEWAKQAERYAYQRNFTPTIGADCSLSALTEPQRLHLQSTLVHELVHALTALWISDPDAVPSEGIAEWFKYLFCEAHDAVCGPYIRVAPFPETPTMPVLPPFDLALEVPHPLDWNGQPHVFSIGPCFPEEAYGNIDVCLASVDEAPASSPYPDHFCSPLHLEDTDLLLCLTTAEAGYRTYLFPADSGVVRTQVDLVASTAGHLRYYSTRTIWDGERFFVKDHNLLMDDVTFDPVDTFAPTSKPQYDASTLAMIGLDHFARQHDPQHPNAFLQQFGAYIRACRDQQDCPSFYTALAGPPFHLPNGETAPFLALVTTRLTTPAAQKKPYCPDVIPAGR